MESFIVRIYHRSEGGVPTVAGTLESVATGLRRSFRSQVELLDMLEMGPEATRGAVPAAKRGAVAARAIKRKSGSAQ